MARKEIGPAWDRDARNAMNHNDKELYDGLNNAAKLAVEQIGDEFDAFKAQQSTQFLEAVATVAERDAKYPQPNNGDTVRVTGEATYYRYEGGRGWVKTDQYNPTAIDQVNQQLADKSQEIKALDSAKMDKGTTDIAPAQINKNLGKFDQTYMTDEFLQQIVGKTPINAVPADGSTTTSKLANLAVTPEKTDFMKSSPNLFNKNAVVSGRLNSTTGQVEIDSNWITSDWIPAEQTVSYKRSLNAMIVFYDANKNILSGFGASTAPVTSVSGTQFMRVSVQKENLDQIQLEKGTVSTDYREFNAVEVPRITVYEKNLDRKTKDLLYATDGLRESISAFSENEHFKVVNVVEPEDPTLIMNGKYEPDFLRKWGKMSRGWRMTTYGTATSEIRFNFASPKYIPKIAALGVMVYLEDASKVSSVEVYVNTGSGYKWVRSSGSSPFPLKNGWNMLRWAASSSDITGWGNFSNIRFLVYTNGATNYTLGKIFAELPPKAQILFIEDGGYQTFLKKGYPQLKARGIPTTWALNPGRLGEPNNLTEADIEALAEDPESDFNFHSWQSRTTSTMTEDELRKDTIKCIRWIQSRGLQPKYWWRSAFTQNNAPNHAAIRDLVEAYASPIGTAAINVFPFIERWNVGRYLLHGRTPAQMDSVFSTLQQTHQLLVCYTHDINDAGGADMTNAEWDYFIQKIDEGLEGGWLEGVTYDILRTRLEQKIGGYGFENLIQMT